MPDKWEFPWYASWDLAFHCVALALVDPDFAKEQLMLIVRENDERDCLYDVVNGDTRDASIRPNQILAVSLPYSMLDRERSREVLQAIETHLLTPLGLRSLAPSDPAYRPHL